jgi:membrane protease subunit (stomatin/prohibitin family)
MTRPLVTVVHGLPEDPDHVNETREMNDSEYAQYQIDQTAAQAQAAAQAEADATAQAKKDAAAAALAKLGITQDVLDLLTK